MSARNWAKWLLWTTLLLISSGLCAGSGFAQQEQRSTITGTVKEAENGEPLADAHVFLAESTLGTVTDSLGRYRLTGVPSGRATIVVSRVGFRPKKKQLRVRAGDPHQFDVSLQPKPIRLQEVVVDAERDERWQNRLQKFRSAFLGTSRVAQSAEIENPEVLHFSTTENGGLRARAAEPLLINHAALGYRIRYILQDFVAHGEDVRYKGEPLYEPMTPKTEAEQERWQEARRRTYAGSFMHFVHTATSDRCGTTGFEVKIRGGRDLTLPCEDLFEPRSEAKIFEFDLRRGLRIIYDDHQTSVLVPRHRPVVLVDIRRGLVSPYSVKFGGVMGDRRVGDKLPLGYPPEQ